MWTVLVVASPEQKGRPAEEHNPSVEILHARGMEDALEKLGRNRRIDAVLLAAGSENRQIARSIREDNPAPPPLFVPQGEPIPGARNLPARELPDLLNLLLLELG